MGAILSFDMTKESTISKLSYLIGKNYSSKKIKILMMSNLRGELTEKY
jgi:L-asparaginase/Glu-tRNA(Gln) amidotransferase subunit D